MPVQFLQGKEITTIEGIDSQHPIKQAWIAEQVPQCGYCQSGQMMSAYSLLSQNPSASKDEIKQFMSGNICRCGTYPKIMKAIKSSQKAMQENVNDKQASVQIFQPNDLQDSQS